MRNTETSMLAKRAIAFNIRRLRKERKITQTDFAEMVGVCRSYLSQIEHAKMNVSIDVLVKIADGLNVPLVALFEGLEGRPLGSFPKEVSYSFIELPRKTRKRS